LIDFVKARPMTEADWDDCTDPQAMLSFLQDSGKTTDRKLRLFTCACLRAVWDLIAYDWGRQAAEAVERYLEGEIPPAAAAEALARLQESFRHLLETRERANAAIHVVSWACLPLDPTEPEAERIDRRRRPLTAAEEAANYAAQAAGWPEPQRGWDWSPHAAAGMERQLCRVLRDIFGNPFHPRPVVAPSLLGWRNGRVVNLAQSAYDNRLLPSGHLDPARLSVLADALLDAGCQDVGILKHLRRAEGPHVRGCRVVDLLSGKE
jgi:hypothetical protein